MSSSKKRHAAHRRRVTRRNAAAGSVLAATAAVLSTAAPAAHAHYSPFYGEHPVNVSQFVNLAPGQSLTVSSSGEPSGFGVASTYKIAICNGAVALASGRLTPTSLQDGCTTLQTSTVPSGGVIPATTVTVPSQVGSTAASVCPVLPSQAEAGWLCALVMFDATLVDTDGSFKHVGYMPIGYRPAAPLLAAVPGTNDVTVAGHGMVCGDLGFVGAVPPPACGVGESYTVYGVPAAGGTVAAIGSGVSAPDSSYNTVGTFAGPGSYKVYVQGDLTGIATILGSVTV